MPKSTKANSLHYAGNFSDMDQMWITQTTNSLAERQAIPGDVKGTRVEHPATEPHWRYATHCQLQMEQTHQGLVERSIWVWSGEQRDHTGHEPRHHHIWDLLAISTQGGPNIGGCGLTVDAAAD